MTIRLGWSAHQPAEGFDLAKQRSTFGKLERARAKQARAKAKRDGRTTREPGDAAGETDDSHLRPLAPADEADILAQFAELQSAFDDGRMTLDDFEAKRNELRDRLQM